MLLEQPDSRLSVAVLSSSLGRGDGMVDIGVLNTPGSNAVRVQVPPSVLESGIEFMVFLL